MVQQYTSSFTPKQDRSKKNASSSVVLKMQPLSFVDNSDHNLCQPLKHTKVRISVMCKAAILETISSKTYFVISFVHRVVNLDGEVKLWLQSWYCLKLFTQTIWKQKKITLFTIRDNWGFWICKRSKKQLQLSQTLAHNRK